MSNLIFLTGGTGFLGHHLVPRLRRAGYRVRLLARPASRVDWLPRQGVEIFPGDVTDPAGLEIALHGCSAVIHAAGLFRFWGAEEAFERVNHHGTRLVAQAAVRAGVERFVHISTIAVVGRPPSGPFDENVACRPQDAYQRSKLAGERAVRTLAERDMKKLGKSGPDQAPPIKRETRRVPKGIDPGWAYAPGKEWHRAFVKQQVDPDAWLKSLPAHVQVQKRLSSLQPRPYPADKLLPSGLDDQDYIDAFLKEFGMEPGERYLLYEDVSGELLLISDDLFREASGQIKVTKRGRERFMRMLAETIKNPQEIWLSDKGGNLRRRYVVLWNIEGSDKSALAVFETGNAGWVGITITALVADDIDYIMRRVRVGERIYEQK